MKKRMKMVTRVMVAAVASMMLFTGCVGKVTKSVISETQTTESESSENISGGYSEEKRISAEDQKLFDTVMSTLDNGKTYEAVSVSTQVVAGTNYRFAVNITEDGKKKEGFVTIYQPLPGQGDAEFVSEE